jgi:hypothetical protein
LQARWTNADLTALIAAGAISELDLVPPDWRGVTVAIGVLGGKTSVLAAIAYAALSDAALQIRIANMASRRRPQTEYGRDTLSSADRTMAPQSIDRFSEQTTQLVAELQQWVADAVDVLHEAIWHAPGGREPLAFDDSALVTEGARRLIAQLTHAAAAEAHQTPHTSAASDVTARISLRDP